MSASSTKSRLHLNSFEIKIIALIFMTFDHFGAYQTFTTNLSINDFFRIVGRIAAPLFLFVFILLGIAWYYIKDKRINCITFAALALLCFFVPDSIFYTLPLRCFSPLYFNISDLFIDGQWCMCLALPFMLLYDGEKGHSMKYFFYIYYPIHVYVLIIISQLRSASF